MRVLSLFSGGGLGDYGLELAGMEIVGQVEIDEYCQKILKLRWPDVPKWRDVREVTGEQIRERCGTVDLISGGFPCQDLSTAGKGEGIEGSRSGLWKEYWRIICEVRPRFVFVENVSAILSRGLGVVLGDLAAIGFDAEWECLPSSAFNKPHVRDRFWLVAYPNGIGREKSKDEIKRVFSKKVVAKWKPNCSYLPLKYFGHTFKTFPNDLRMDDGSPDELDSIKMCGNGQDVQVVEWIGKRIMEFDKSMREKKWVRND